jgi:hypothetical protein
MGSQSFQQIQAVLLIVFPKLLEINHAQAMLLLNFD